MALCYHTGIGVTQDITKAHDLWLDAVEKGHPDSFHYCQLVANVGYPRGQFMLGHHYQHGIDTPANIQVALQLFHQAAEQGYAPAQCRLGILYSEGNYGIARGPEVAVKWFQLATHQNNPVAISRLAYCLYDGDGITQNKDEAARLWHSLSQPTTDNPNGNPAGQYGLGLVLTDKDYTGYNPKKGIKELHKAAKQDFVLAQYLLGMFYYNSLDDAIKQDYKQARYWLNKAAKQRDHIAQYHLGEIYYNGNDVSINYRKAYQYYRQSADGCYIPAMQKLAHLCLEGIGTKKDEAEGYHLLAMLANNNDEEAITLLRSAATTGNHYAEYAMWVYYQSNGDYESGHTWLEQSAGKDNSDALCALALYYETENDPAQAKHYFRLAAKKGHAYAQMRYGLLLETFADYKSPQNKEAYKWLKKSADQKHPHATYCLGNFYKTGIWVDAEAEKSFEIYNKAANLGNVDAFNRLGEA